MSVWKYINKYSPKEEVTQEVPPQKDYSALWTAVQDTMEELEHLKAEKEDIAAMETLNKMKAAIKRYL